MVGPNELQKNVRPHMTHSACPEQLRAYGGQALGCCCTGHQCAEYTTVVAPLSSVTLLCAFDYAIGRKTYVVHYVVADIANSLKFLTDKDKRYMAGEIARRYSTDDLGMDFDRDEWVKLLELLEKQI